MLGLKKNFGLNSIDSQLLPILVKEQDVEATLMEKSNRFFIPNLMILNFWKQKKLLAEQKVFIPLLKFTNFQSPNFFSHGNAAIVTTKCETLNFPRRLFQTVNRVTVRLVNQIRRIMITY